MRYIVGQRGPLKVGDDMRQPGEAVPEAAEWPHLHTWVSGGYVVQLPDGAETAQAGTEQGATLSDVLAFIATAGSGEDLITIGDALNARLEALARELEAKPVIDTGDDFDITAVNADQAKAWIAETTDIAALEAKNEREVQSQKHEGGRVSVLRAIEARIAELERPGDEDEDADEEGDEE